MSDIAAGTRPDSVNYKVYQTHNGRYRYQRYPLSNIASASVAVHPSSTTELQWTFPANVDFNPSKKLLEYNQVFAGEAGRCIWVYEDAATTISSIKFGNASGEFMVDLPYANMYTSVVTKLDTDKEEFETNDIVDGLSRAPIAADNYFPPGIAIPAGNVYNEPVAAGRITAIYPDVRYARHSLALGGAVRVRRSIPLSIFKGTFLAMDKDVKFGEEMYLTIQVAPSNMMGYTTDKITDPTSDPKPFATQPTLTQVYMQLASQQDAVMLAEVQQKFESAEGLKMIFPYVQTWRTPSSVPAVGTPTPTSITLNMVPTMGMCLKRIVHSVFNASADPNRVYDHHNMDGDKILSYRTNLGNKPLQNDILQCSQTHLDDWRENRFLLKGSAIENSASYYYNWLHCDSFCNPSRSSSIPEDNMLEGIPITEQLQWVFEGTALQNLQHYTWATLVRTLVSKRSTPTEVRRNAL